jgi:molybdenum cofactor synthesis domain-containing protein
MLEVAVITVSDRAYKGEYEDLSGPKIRKIIQSGKIGAKVDITVVPDEKEAVREALTRNLDKDYIITTGGTGLSPRDITPEVTEELCDKELPGISEFLRRESYKEIKHAVLSRGYSGIKGHTIIVNFPGSVKAVTLCTRLLLPILEHGKEMIHGGKH